MESLRQQLERALFLAQRGRFVRDEEIELALEVATYGGAKLVGRPTGFTPGYPPPDLTRDGHLI